MAHPLMTLVGIGGVAWCLSWDIREAPAITQFGVVRAGGYYRVYETGKEGVILKDISKENMGLNKN